MLNPSDITTYQRQSNAAAGYCASCRVKLHPFETHVCDNCAVEFYPDLNTQMLEEEEGDGPEER